MPEQVNLLIVGRFKIAQMTQGKKDIILKLYDSQACFLFDPSKFVAWLKVKPI